MHSDLIFFYKQQKLFNFSIVSLVAPPEKTLGWVKMTSYYQWRS